MDPGYCPLKGVTAVWAVLTKRVGRPLTQAVMTRQDGRPLTQAVLTGV